MSTVRVDGRSLSTSRPRSDDGGIRRTPPYAARDSGSNCTPDPRNSTSGARDFSAVRSAATRQIRGARHAPVCDPHPTDHEAAGFHRVDDDFHPAAVVGVAGEHRVAPAGHRRTLPPGRCRAACCPTGDRGRTATGQHVAFGLALEAGAGHVVRATRCRPRATRRTALVGSHSRATPVPPPSSTTAAPSTAQAAR